LDSLEETQVKRTTLSISLLLLGCLLAVTSTGLAADKMPTATAGDIGVPAGQIAFNRNGDVWVMDADGANQDKICEITNADGRMSWSPDGRSVAFTRSGQVDLKGPDNMGGRHKVYDIFIASLDSAYHNNRLFWMRLTTDLGSRDPEWSPDGSLIYFCKDMNANTVNALKPNYQLCTMPTDGSKITPLREDWSYAQDDFLMAPTVSKSGQIATVLFADLKPAGLAVIPQDQINMEMDSIKAQAAKNASLVAPAWSPDGKWLAYVSNDMNNPGVQVASADMTERFLVFAPPVGTYLYTVAPSFSPDSKWLTFATTDGSVWIVDITGNGARRLSGPGSDRDPAWSKNVKE
jgi:Tol biopolymer transport system component